MKVGALVLAAGAASRFGGDKPGALVGGRASISHVMRAAETAGLAPLLVVSNAAASIAEGWQRVPSPEADLGIAHSLCVGLRSIGGRCGGVLVLLADMPLVHAQTLRALADALTSPQDIVVPMQDGKRGNPVGWGAAHWPALTALEGDRGGGMLLPTLELYVRRVPVDDPGVLLDFDTVGQLAALERISGRG